MSYNESDEDFYKRISDKLKRDEELGINYYVDDLNDFKENYKTIYDETLNEIIGYAGRLARQAQMTISLILSNFEIDLCLEDVTKSIQLTNNKNGINRFSLNVNINYWLSLGELNKNFDKKSAVLEEVVTSFYLLHLLLSKDKNPKIWSLCSELETTQYLQNDVLSQLDPWSVDDISRMLDLELPNGAVAEKYYDLINDEIEKQKANENVSQEMQEFLKQLKNSKHNDTRFQLDLSNDSNAAEIEMDSMKHDIIRALTNVQDIVESSNSNNSSDKSWGVFSQKIHSIIQALKPNKPLIDYKSILRRTVGKVKGGKRSSYRRPCRYDKGFIAKGTTVDYNYPHVLVAIDVSGSVRDEEIITALGEICHIKKGKITVMQFDTELVSKVSYTSKQWSRLLKQGYTLHARGGTDFRIPVKEFESNLFSKSNKMGYSTMIVFTDGGCSSCLPKLKNGKINTKAIKRIKWIITEFGSASLLLKEYPKESILYLHNSTYNTENENS